MSRKVLFVATVDYHFRAFHLPYLKWFKDQGYEVHVAASGNIELPYVDAKFDIPIQRSPLHRANVDAYVALKSILAANHYEIIHCHTPMGGVLARLAARSPRKKGTKVMYTAHGFHFCQGAPLFHWLAYYPLEKFLSYFTDCLITINEEDYKLAVNRGFRANQIEHVYGVGVNTERFQPISESHKAERKISMGYQPSDILLFYAAEFNVNKNQQQLIRALAEIRNEAPHIKLLLAGEGALQVQCQELARELQVAGQVKFLGYRKDIDGLLPMCDIAVASSHREGLPVNIMEAMACGLPVVASDNRGHRELVLDGDNGWLTPPNDHQGMAEKLLLLVRDQQLRIQLGSHGRQKVNAKYAVERVLHQKSAIYARFMDEKEEVM